MTKEVDDFVQSTIEELEKLKLHDLISKMQSAFFKEKRLSIQPGEIVIGGDFSENYTPVVQDAVQSHHWNKQGTTIHPWIVYYNDEGQISSKSFAMISDRIIHDPAAINLFQKVLINYIIGDLNIQVNKIFYFTDGCPNQYKCCKNFVNLLYHKADFGVDAEWHFFATSHGKGPYDGIGGTIKRLACQESLRRPKEGQIQTPKDLYNFCSENITGIKTFFISNSEIIEHLGCLQLRFAKAKTLVGTKKFHSFVPISENLTDIKCKSFSTSANFKVKSVL